jgi:hypothetical protein
MAVSRYYSSVARRTTLTADANASTTSLSVAAATGFPSLYPYTLILDQDTVNEEIVTVTNRSGTTLTVERGVDGTSGTSHTAGASVEHGVSARDFTESRQHEDNTEAVHGLGAGAAVVGTTSAQTLTNKTLTAPAINAATVTGTVSGGTLSGQTITNGTLGSNLAAGGFKVTGLADPSNAQDAATKNYADTGMTSQLNLATSARIAAEAAQVAAELAETNAETAESGSVSAKNAAESARDAAVIAKDAAELAETNAELAETNAELAETNAAASAGLANEWATKTGSAVAGGEFSAKYHAQAAAASAGTAGDEADAAAASALAADGSASAALASANSAAASFDSFDDRYLGAKTSDPTLDNDGNPLIEGALYFNSVDNTMYVRTAGAAWATLAASLPSTISANSTTPALQVTQTGSGVALLVEDSASPDASPFVVDTEGRGVFGHTSAVANPVATSRLQVHGIGTGGASTFLADWANAANGFLDIRGKSRGATVGTNGVVSSGDGLYQLRAYGDDGTAFVEAARITAAVDGTPGTNDMPGRLMFSTTADGASTPTERMRITNAGYVGIGTAAPNGLLHIAGTSSTARLHIDADTADSDGAALGHVLWRAPVAYTSGDTRAVILSAAVDGTTAGNRGGRFEITTRNDGGTLSERMRVNNAGLITGTGTSLGEWTFYTPTLGGTGWAIGNGTIAGRYCQIGKIVNFTILVTFGSTSTFGASLPALSVPVTSSTNAIYLSHGDCNDVSAGTFYATQVRRSSTTEVHVRALNASQQYAVLSSTFPFTWTTGDIIRVQGTYEAA